MTDKFQNTQPRKSLIWFSRVIYRKNPFDFILPHKQITTPRIKGKVNSLTFLCLRLAKYAHKDFHPVFTFKVSEVLRGPLSQKG